MFKFYSLSLNTPLDYLSVKGVILSLPSMETLEGDKKKDWFCPTCQDPTLCYISCVLFFLLLLQTAWVTCFMLPHCNVSAYSLICSGEMLMTRKCIGSLIKYWSRNSKKYNKKKTLKSLDKVAILHQCGNTESRGFTQTYKHSYQLTIVPTL